MSVDDLEDMTFEELLESIIGRTIMGVEAEDDEVFLVLDDDTAFGIGYDRDDGMVIRQFLKDTTRYN